jgi:hypothetical protein
MRTPATRYRENEHGEVEKVCKVVIGRITFDMGDAGLDTFQSMDPLQVSMLLENTEVGQWVETHCPTSRLLETQITHSSAIE